MSNEKLKNGIKKTIQFTIAPSKKIKYLGKNLTNEM